MQGNSLTSFGECIGNVLLQELLPLMAFTNRSAVFREFIFGNSLPSSTHGHQHSRLWDLGLYEIENQCFSSSPAELFRVVVALTSIPFLLKVEMEREKCDDSNR